METQLAKASPTPEESKDSKLATIVEVSEDSILKQQQASRIFADIEYAVIYQTGVVLVLNTGNIKRVFLVNEYIAFEDDKLSQKIALKINPHGFEGYFLSHHNRIIWLRVVQQVAGKQELEFEVKDIQGLPVHHHHSLDDSALFQTFLSYNVLAAMHGDFTNRMHIWDISPLLRKAKYGDTGLMSVSQILRPFHNTMKPGHTPPFQVNPALYLYLENETSELVYNVLYLGEEITTSLCIYDGVSTPFQVIATSMGRLFAMPLF